MHEIYEIKNWGGALNRTRNAKKRIEWKEGGKRRGVLEQHLEEIKISKKENDDHLEGFKMYTR